MAELHELGADELTALYRSGEVSPVEATRAVLRHIERWEPHLKATYALDADAALEMARASEARWRRGEPVREEASTADETEERFFVGLRLMAGIRPRPEERLRFDVPIQRFLDEGLLEEEDGVLRLTSRGVLLSNEVFQEFVTV